MLPKNYDWIKPGTKVYYVMNNNESYSGTVDKDGPWLLAGFKWAVDLVDMDDLYYAMYGKRMLIGVSCRYLKKIKD